MSAAHAPIKASPVLKEKLKKLGLFRPEDLVLHLPLRYEDETRITLIQDAALGLTTQIEVKVTAVSIQFRPRRQLIVHANDESASLILRFLNFYPSQHAQFETAISQGEILRVVGEIRLGGLGREMVHPRYRIVAPDTPLPTALTPIYPTSAGISQMALRKLILHALSTVSLQDTLSDAWCEKHHLPRFADALSLLHHPPQSEKQSLIARVHPAWQRIKFDELLAQQLSMRRAYLLRRQEGAPRLSSQGCLATRLILRLAFKLTNAQERALAEIKKDLSTPYPMQRLLQGDVGSGKTIIAALAACEAIEAGFQAVFMAPTEILAEQHFLKFKSWFAQEGLEIVWLSGHQKKKDKALALSNIAKGAPLIIGTHALIQTPVDFARLGLVIIDEQHRFGVAQRLALRQKGEKAAQTPHQLMMSATPIPRTLAMSYYADLDISIIDELPPGRTPIRTKLISDTRREEIIVGIHTHIQAGRQAYWVCPLIEESEKQDLQAAEKTYAMLKEALPSLRVALIHGKLKADEKTQIMANFVRGEIDLLVATTVIEVGVDVANANLMIIEHAERFGLAQLHQLRGRVGRGEHASTCILLYQTPLSDMARARLKTIFENTDGFKIAQEDLQQRGPGEFIGSRQSGLPLLRYAELEADSELIALAKTHSEYMIEKEPEATARHLMRWHGTRQDMLKA